MQEIIWTYCFSTFATFNTQPLWILIQGQEQSQESHYIQPSNLSSAFSNIFHDNPYDLYFLGLFGTMT